MSPVLPHIGWIGTGVMGRHMCRHLLQKGYPLTVYNRTQSKAEAVVQEAQAQEGSICKLGTSPYEIAKEVDVMILMVGTPKDVRSLVLGDQSDSNSESDSPNILGSMKEGSLLIDHTTSSPGLAVEIAEAARKKNISVVDAPVSGGDIGARNGQVSSMCGYSCTKDSFDTKVRPILDSYSKSVQLLGSSGSGQHCKMGNQIAIAGSMIGLCESMLYAQKANLDVKQFIDTISTGAAGSKSLDLYGNRILNKDFQPGFYVEHFVKDMNICLDECRRMGLALPGLALVHQLYMGLRNQENGKGGKLGTHGLVKVLEKLNGME